VLQYEAGSSLDKYIHKYCVFHNSKALNNGTLHIPHSSSLVTASRVGPGVVWISLRGLQVPAVVAPPGGVAPGPPRVVSALASAVGVPVLVPEC